MSRSGAAKDGGGTTLGYEPLLAVFTLTHPYLGGTIYFLGRTATRGLTGRPETAYDEHTVESASDDSSRSDHCRVNRDNCGIVHRNCRHEPDGGGANLRRTL